MRLVLILVILCTATTCFGGNILGIFHHSGKSHCKLGEVLLRTLAKRGHQVVMVSPYPLKTPMKNYRDIDLPEVRIDMDERLKNNWFQKFTANPNFYAMLTDMSHAQSEFVFKNKEFKALMASGQKFDVCIMDSFLNLSHYIFSKIFNCAIILSGSPGNADNRVMGDTAPVSYVPNKFFPLTDRMDFFDRMLNAFIYLFAYYNDGPIYAKQQEILNRNVPNAPEISELIPSIALIFSNAHWSYETPRPLVPNVIEVGGYHIEEPKPLPKDIKEFADGAKDGFIYFSLGSNMKAEFLDKDKQQSLIAALSKLPVKVLWKLDQRIEGLPASIKVSNWLPQSDLLAHPNLKIFITHGGLLSTIESIHYGVPMIGIPQFGDQNSNVPIGVNKGYSLLIKSADLSEQTLTAAINEMLSNSSYTEKAKLYSSFLRDQPIKPMDKAVFWMEHVIRHKGADHLKNASINLAWYQYFLLDVIAFILGVLIAVLGISYHTTKFVLKKILRLFKKGGAKTSAEKKIN